jgi:hypothetical protein
MIKDSYIGQVADAMKPYAAELTAKGFDPTSRLAQLSGAGELIQGAVKVRETAEKGVTAQRQTRVSASSRPVVLQTPPSAAAATPVFGGKTEVVCETTSVLRCGSTVCPRSPRSSPVTASPAEHKRLRERRALFCSGRRVAGKPQENRRRKRKNFVLR